jgi:hypothetical protein
LDASLLSLAGQSLAHPTKQVFDTLCGRVRQDAGSAATMKNWGYPPSVYGEI